MTGWRIGYAAMPGAFGARLIKAMGTLQGQMTTNITSFNYPAIRCALTDGGVAEDVERMRLAFAARAGLVKQRLDAIDGVRVPHADGGVLCVPGCVGAVRPHLARGAGRSRGPRT